MGKTREPKGYVTLETYEKISEDKKVLVGKKAQIITVNSKLQTVSVIVKGTEVEIEWPFDAISISMEVNYAER